jgi:hypothetical protein
MSCTLSTLSKLPVPSVPSVPSVPAWRPSRSPPEKVSSQSEQYLLLLCLHLVSGRFPRLLSSIWFARPPSSSGLLHLVCSIWFAGR